MMLWIGLGDVTTASSPSTLLNLFWQNVEKHVLYTYIISYFVASSDALVTTSSYFYILLFTLNTYYTNNLCFLLFCFLSGCLCLVSLSLLPHTNASVTSHCRVDSISGQPGSGYVKHQSLRVLSGISIPHKDFWRRMSSLAFSAMCN